MDLSGLPGPGVGAELVERADEPKRQQQSSRERRHGNPGGHQRVKAASQPAAGAREGVDAGKREHRRDHE